ncbi:MAG: hypothetical protein HY707_09625 [Ignavibacteriae bacterium]|nr:hypothetical protein [Ignavibacteriota bacterium]
MNRLFLFSFTVLLLIAASTALLAQNLTKPLISGPAGIRVNSFTGNMFYQRGDLFITEKGFSLDVMFVDRSR